jgi:hypothetical protein
MRNEGTQAFAYHCIKELIAVFEVVMNHGGSQAGAMGNGSESRGCNPLLGECLCGCINQLGARIAVWIGNGAAWSIACSSFASWCHILINQLIKYSP